MNAKTLSESLLSDLKDFREKKITPSDLKAICYNASIINKINLSQLEYNRRMRKNIPIKFYETE